MLLKMSFIKLGMLISHRLVELFASMTFNSFKRTVNGPFQVIKYALAGHPQIVQLCS